MAESQSDAYEKLFAFCASGDRIGLANHIITSGCNPTDYNARDSSGKTPLHVACQHGHLFTVRALVEIFGCSRSAEDNNGNLPIHVACLHGHLNVVDYLIHFRGTDSTHTVLATDSGGNTLFHKACQSGSVPLVRYLQEILCYNSKQLVLRKLSLYVDTVGGYSRVSLKKMLSHRKDILIYRALLKPNVHGDTPLHLACRFGNLSVLKLFRAYIPFMADNSLELLAAQSNHFHIVTFVLSLKRLPFLDFDSESLVKQSDSSIQQFELLDEPVFDCSRSQLHSLTVVKKTVRCLKCLRSFAVKELSEYEDYTLKGTCPICSHLRLRTAFYPRCPECIHMQTSIVDPIGECSHCHTRICFKISQNYTENFGSDSDYGYSSILQTPSQYALKCGNLDAFLRLQVSSKTFLKDMTLLHAVCISNDPRAVAEVMKRLNCGPNVLDSESNTPLHIACQWGSIKVILYLLEFEDIQIGVLNEDNESPLSVACRNNLTDVCEQLLKRADCKAISYPNGETPLHLACSNNNLKLVKLIIKNSGTSFVNIPDKYGDTPLFNACRNEHMEMINYLLKFNSNPFHINSVTKDTPVHIACRMGKSDILKALLRPTVAGESLEGNIVDATPIQLAIEGNFPDIIRVLINCSQIDFNKALNKRSGTLFHFIAISGHLDLAKLLLKFDFENWNAQDIEGNTALHLACMQNDNEMVEIILQKCDYMGITIQNNRKQTPLHIAVFNGSVNITVSILRIFSGSLDEYKDVDGDNVLHTACKVNAQLDMVSRLLKFCSLTVKNNISKIPLHIACQAGNISIVKLLLEHTPESCKLEDYVDKDGNSVLHAAVQSGCVVIVNTLLQYTSPLWTNNEGETPIHISCRNGNVEVTHALLAKSEDQVVFSAEGDSYLHSACRGSSFEIVKHLIKESGLDQHKLFSANKSGNRPLHLACISGISVIISLMISSNSLDTCTLNNDGLTPFCCLLVEGHVNTVKELLLEAHVEFCTDQQPMVHCIVNHLKDIQSIFSLLWFITTRKISNVIEMDSKGNTILHTFFKRQFSERNSVVYEEILNHFLTLPGIQINKQNNNGDTPLHLLVQLDIDKDLLDRLLERGFNDSISVCNNQNKAPITLSKNKYFWILIRYGANPSDVDDKYISQCIRYAKYDQPLDPLMKIITLGNSKAGKTTLITTLKQLDAPHRQIKTTDLEERTAGIQTSDHNSKEFGCVTFHDFGGQPEYESGNAVFLKSLASFAFPSVLLLVVDVRASQLPEKGAQYWCDYIKNSLPVQLDVPPHVIVVGSHSDQIVDLSQNEKIKRSISSAVHKVVDFRIADVILLNCKDLEEVKILSSMLAECRRNLIQAVEIDCRCHILSDFLVKYYRGSSAVKFFNLQKRIEQVSGHNLSILLPTTTKDLLSLLNSLQSRGHLNLLNVENIENCWIVLKNNSLFEYVNGILFAPDDSNLQKLETNNGVVSEQELSSKLRYYDIDLITSFVTHSELCQRIDDQETLQLIEMACQVSVKSSPNTDKQLLTISKTNNLPTMEESDVDEERPCMKYYFFPGLLKRERTHKNFLWEDSSHCFRWCLNCHENDYLTSRFIHVLLLRLTFNFAMAEKSFIVRQKCDIWKNGVHWSTIKGVEVLVEVVKQNTAVLLLMEFRKGCEMEGVQYRSQVIKKILDTKKEFCPAVRVAECVCVLKDGCKYPPTNSRFFFIGEIARAICEDDSYVNNCDYDTRADLKTLLYFDSYFNNELLMYLWKEGQENEDDDLNVVSRMLKNFTEYSLDTEDRHAVEKWKRKMLKVIDSKKGEWSREELRKEFDSWSIFCGRNPLVSINFY